MRRPFGRSIPASRFAISCVAICPLAACLPAMSVAADDASKKCGPGIYCVEEMLCIGRIDGTPPPEMNSNFYVSLLTLRSAKLVRKDKTLADGLMMDDVPLGDDHPNIMMEEAKKLADWTKGQTGPPARVKDRHVSTNWETIGFSDGLSLTIEAAEPHGSYRLDVLNGSVTYDGTTVGSYKMNYQCEAAVVDAPSLVMDDK